MTWLHILISYTLNPIIIAICVYIPSQGMLKRENAKILESEIVHCICGLILYSLWLALNATVAWFLGATFSLIDFMGVQYGGMFYFPYAFSAIFLSYHLLIKDALYTRPALMNFLDNMMTMGFIISAYILMNYYLAWIYKTFYLTL